MTNVATQTMADTAWKDESIVKSTMRRGVTIIELSVVLIIAGIIAIAAFTGYNKIYLPTKADSEYKKIAAVFSGIERARTLNGSVYPVMSGQINTIPMISNALGGAKGTKDVQDWVYNCSGPGSNQTITLTTGAVDDPVVAALVQDMINNNNDNWSATINSNNQIVASKANAVCG